MTKGRFSLEHKTNERTGKNRYENSVNAHNKSANADSAVQTNARNTPRKKQKRVLNTLGKIVVSVFAVVLVTLCVGIISFIGTRDNVGSFPVSFSAEAKDIQATKNHLYIAQQSVLTTFDSAAKNSVDKSLSFSDCKIKTNGKYALAYDRLGTGFVLMKDGKPVLPKMTNESGQINTCFVTEKGYFVIASKSKEAASELTVYSPNGVKMFVWRCSSDYIVSVCSSDNGRYVLCACLNAAGGERVSRVYYFDIENEDKNRDYTYNNTYAIDCFFAGKNKGIIVCNDRRIIIDLKNDKSTPNTVTFDSDIVSRANSTNGLSYVVLMSGEIGNEYSVICYDKNNNIKFISSIAGKVKAIACCGRKVYVLTDSEILSVGSKNKKLCDVTSDTFGILSNGDTLYYYSSDYLYKV